MFAAVAQRDANAEAFNLLTLVKAKPRKVKTRVLQIIY